MGVLSNEKLNHFKKRLAQANMMVWDAEFHVEKLKGIREEIRFEYDRKSEQVAIAKGKLDAEQKRKDKDRNTVESLEKFIKENNDDLDQLKAQMAKLDAEINDSNTPNGALTRLQAARSLRELLTEHLAKVKKGKV